MTVRLIDAIICYYVMQLFLLMLGVNGGKVGVFVDSHNKMAHTLWCISFVSTYLSIYMYLYLTKEMFFFYNVAF